jgi:DNA-binding MarR family transcriptional regulator
MTDILQTTVVLEQARAIGPLERRVLRALRDKGPGLLLEVAVRVLSFPEQITPVLRDLRERGLIRAERFGGSALGDELWSVTPLGAQTLDAAEALEQRSVGAPAPAEAMDGTALHQSVKQQEAELLHKLGDIAVRAGDTARAAEYYEQALKLVRQMRETPAS